MANRTETSQQLIISYFNRQPYHLLKNLETLQRSTHEAMTQLQII